MHVTAIVLQVILGLAFLMAGFTKFGTKQQVQAFQHYGYSQGFRIFTGLVEIVTAAGLIAGIWQPAVATLAGILLGVTMLGAVITHIRVKDPGKVLSMPILFLVLAVAVPMLNHWML